MDNLKEMEKFLEMSSLPTLNQEEVETISRLVTSNEIESIIKLLPTDYSPGLDDFTGEFYQTFRKELTPIIFKQFQKSCSCRDTYTFILPSQHHPDTKKKRERASSHTKRKLHANISDEREYKNP